MPLDGMDIDEDGLSSLGNTASEQSEQQRERASKTLQNIKKSQKDEKKGKKASSILASFLLELLKNPKYDVFLEPIFTLLQKGVPSVYCVGILSLLSLRISETIHMEYSGVPGALVTEPEAERSVVEFDGKHIRNDIRARINLWIEDICSVITTDPSVILTKKFRQIAKNSEIREDCISAIEVVVVYFFQTLNIVMPKSESRPFAVFVWNEIESKVQGISLEDF